MNLIDNGLDKRVIQLMDLTSDDRAVLTAEKAFDKHFQALIDLIGNNQELLWLEATVNQMRFAEVEAGYRIGLADGMQLQQEINQIREGLY